MAEETYASRSGRVVITAGVKKTIILGAFKGQSKGVYRIFNGGKNGSAVEVFEGNNPNAVHELDWKDSVDVVVGNDQISVKAGGTDAEIVYDLVAAVS
ncbi:hypothetical protein [Rubinisphaera margarita]|uniref:hypothetical protein n=1 Tax=Rubinisphaera margarita TaxID=2909586 RepID=UPI001EE81369|nr:hypothetical protein [Rubinisphaera margarita]MCG6155699.1 hypothetical protein [Rubinisphaera margarita]